MQYIIKNFSTLVLSIFLAVLVWIAAVREQNPPREADYDHDIPIEVISPGRGLVATNVMPKIIRLRLLAPESSWANLTTSKFQAWLDLSTLPTGLSDAPVQVEISDSRIKIVAQEPQVVPVHLELEQTIVLPVKVVVMDSAPLGYISRTPVAEPATVRITGPASLIGQIDEAISEIFIRSAKETVISTRTVAAHDREDQPISGLKIDPDQVKVTLPIEQRFGYKDVSVSAVIEGQVAPGYWVSNVSIDPPTLTIVGNPKVLGEIPGLIETAPINLDRATSNIVRTVPLDLPDGVTVVMPDKRVGQTGGVRVQVAVAAIESGQTVRRPVTQQGIDPAYWWTASPENAEVILSGPIPRLQILKPGEVKVIVDLFGLGPGVYKVEPSIFVPDDLAVEAVLPKVVEITIGVANAPTSPIPTPTAAVTPVVTSTATSTAEPEARLAPIYADEKDKQTP